MQDEDKFEIYFADSHARWEEADLMDHANFAEFTTFVWQTEHGDGTLSGSWWHGDEPTRTVYGGIFGTHNSPGASGYTWAVVFDDVNNYEDAVSRCKQIPEYATSGKYPFVSFLDYVCGRDDR